MAINFATIQNQNLRLLCQNSASINFLPEAQRQNVITKIATLTPEKQAQVEQLLISEKQQLSSGPAHGPTTPAHGPTATARAQTAEQQIKQIEAAEQQLTAIEHEYDAKIRNIREQESLAQDAAAAENLLNLLEKL